MFLFLSICCNNVFRCTFSKKLNAYTCLYRVKFVLHLCNGCIWILSLTGESRGREVIQQLNTTQNHHLWWQAHFSLCYFTIMRWKSLWPTPFRHHQLEVVPCQQQAHTSLCALESRRATVHSTPCQLYSSWLHSSLLSANGLADVSGFYFCVLNTNISMLSVESITMSYRASPRSQALTVWWQY